MTPAAIASQITSWLRIAVVIILLVCLLTAAARALGFILPIKTIGHVELAYLAGAYWLLKG